jgi:hypothetical protein
MADDASGAAMTFTLDDFVKIKAQRQALVQQYVTQRDEWQTEDEYLATEARESAEKKRLQRGTCVWREDPRDIGDYETECGHAWETHGDGSPSERGMVFCCFCGLSLVEDAAR